jgi:hypothetical protein
MLWAQRRSDDNRRLVGALSVLQLQESPIMRALPPALMFSALVLLPGSLFAGDASPRNPQTVMVKPKIAEANPNHETYRGHYVDLSAVADRKDFSELADGFRHQIDIVENSGVSSRVLQFFHTIPIVIDDFACVGNMLVPASGEQKPIKADACYARQVSGATRERFGVSVWESEKGWLVNFDPLTRAITERTGTVMVRPSTLVDRNRERPVLLHELLHAYHDHVLPDGFSNQAALSWFKEATEKHLYSADQYLMTNEREFFAVTTSVFLFGRDGSVDRAQIKQAQPDYYRYLAWLFEFDPDRASSVPVASAN